MPLEMGVCVCGRQHGDEVSSGTAPQPVETSNHTPCAQRSSLSIHKAHQRPGPPHAQTARPVHTPQSRPRFLTWPRWGARRSPGASGRPPPEWWTAACLPHWSAPAPASAPRSGHHSSGRGPWTPSRRLPRRSQPRTHTAGRPGWCRPCPCCHRSASPRVRSTSRRLSSLIASEAAPHCGSATRRYLCPRGSTNPSASCSAARAPVSLRWQSLEMIIQPLGAWSVWRQLNLEERPSKREQLEHGAIVLYFTALLAVA